jgi:hypothetical protein
MSKAGDEMEIETVRIGVERSPAENAGVVTGNLPAWMTEETWNGYLEIQRY